MTKEIPSGNKKGGKFQPAHFTISFIDWVKKNEKKDKFQETDLL